MSECILGSFRSTVKMKILVHHCHSNYHVTWFMCKCSGHFCSYWARISVASLVTCCLWGLLFIWQKNNIILSDISLTPINSVPCQESRTCISFLWISKTSSEVLEALAVWTVANGKQSPTVQCRMAPRWTGMWEGTQVMCEMSVPAEFLHSSYTSSCTSSCTEFWKM